VKALRVSAARLAPAAKKGIPARPARRAHKVLKASAVRKVSLAFQTSQAPLVRKVPRENAASMESRAPHLRCQDQSVRPDPQELLGPAVRKVRPATAEREVSRAKRDIKVSAVRRAIVEKLDRRVQPDLVGLRGSLGTFPRRSQIASSTFNKSWRNSAPNWV
jgi:hypothetical protein